MATHKTGTDISAAARATKLRLLYRHASMRVKAMLDAPRAPLALRAPALRVLARLAAHQPAARAATNAKERVAQLRTLISALSRLITHIEGQPRGARGAAELRKLRTQAQSLLAKELPVPPKGAAPRPSARKTTAKPTVRRKLVTAKRAAKKKGGGGARRSTKIGTKQAATRKKIPAKKPTPAKKASPAKKRAAKPVRKNGARRALKKASAPTRGGSKKSSPKRSETFGAPQGGADAGPAPSTLGIGGTPPTASEPEPVFLGVSAPRAVKPGASFIARFAAYIKAAEAELEKKLKTLGGGKAEVHLGIPPDESARWPVGTPVIVRVTGDGFTAQPAQNRFVWNGSENVVSFVIKPASTLTEGSAILAFEAYIEGIRVAFVPIVIAIAAQPAGGAQSVKVSPARTAFASYASPDRDRVMDKLGALSAYDKALKVFTDCLEMRPGESWKQRLETEIPSSDLFLLFWSRAASASRWVSWEWHTALDKKGLAAIQPMPLEAPQLAPPPPELSSLHFNDIYLIVRDAEIARQGSRRRKSTGARRKRKTGSRSSPTT